LPLDLQLLGLALDALEGLLQRTHQRIDGVLAPAEPLVGERQEAGLALPQRVGAQRLERLNQLSPRILEEPALLGHRLAGGFQPGIGLSAGRPLALQRAPQVTRLEVPLCELLGQLISPALGRSEPAVEPFARTAGTRPA